MTERKKRTYKRKPRVMKPSFFLTRLQIAEKIIKENGFAFEKGEMTVSNEIPDFVNKERKLIVEIELENRDSQKRINGFYRHGYQVVFVAGYIFNIPVAKRTITGMIRGFVE